MYRPKFGSRGHSLEEAIDLKLQPFRGLKRQEAEALLRRSLCIPGSFIIRWSDSSLGNIVISVRVREVKLSDDVAHYLVRKTSGGQTFYLTPDHPFPSFHDLLAHHRDTADGLESNLVAPCCCHPTADKTDVNPWEFKVTSLSLKEVFLSGDMMDLYHADLTRAPEDSVPVMVKRYDGKFQTQFSHEVSVLKQLRNKNVLEFYGLTSTPVYYMISESVQCTLLQHVQQEQPIDRAHQNWLKLETTAIGSQVCSGMEYVHMENYLHRRLSASAVCVNCNKWGHVHCLIGDFSGACEVGDEADSKFEDPDIGTLSIKWMAPEAISSKTFSRKCDVWSFGVLMMEVLSGGEEPYPQLPDELLLHKLMSGYRIPQPDCDYRVFHLVQNCWEIEASQRRTFHELFLAFNGLQRQYQTIVDSERDSPYRNV